MDRQIRRSTLIKERLKEKTAHKQDILQKIDEEAIRPTADESAEVKRMLVSIADEFRNDISQYGFTDAVVRQIEERVAQMCSELEDSSYETQKRIERLAINSITGLGPIQKYMIDPDVTEVVVQRYDNICIERNGLIERVDDAFMDEKHLQTIINRIVQPVGRQINIGSPMVDARLEDGSRVNATIPPATPDGATLTIRKFSDKVLTGESYIEHGSISPEMLEFLIKCVQSKINFIVSGGTNTGKTTLLNMLSGYIPEKELIVTIEDSCELKLRQPNVRRMETRAVANFGEHVMPVDVKALVKNALRMRPDRIIVGEIRDNTIVDMISAMSTGHEGSMCTVHANNPSNLINARFPRLYAGMGYTREEQAIQIAEALQLIIHIKHGEDGGRHISHITHVAGLDEKDRVILKDIFLYDETTRSFTATGYIPAAIITQMKEKKVNITPDLFRKSEVSV